MVILRAEPSLFTVPHMNRPVDRRVQPSSVSTRHIMISHVVVAVSPSFPENGGGVKHAEHGTTHVDPVLTHAPDVQVHVHPFTTQVVVVLVVVPVVVEVSVVVLVLVVVDVSVVVDVTVVVEVLVVVDVLVVDGVVDVVVDVVLVVVVDSQRVVYTVNVDGHATPHAVVYAAFRDRIIFDSHGLSTTAE